ncbi:MAG: Hint domain-containing protein [Candidatus Sungbacteria bacterium]|nr:Hint domain-containing protein [Candidatus Sungbacteria bacterium]
MIDTHRGIIGLIPIVIIFFLTAGAALYFAGTSLEIVPPPGRVWSGACTEEAMQCPDGSFVGRTGPKCEFMPCPDAGYLPPGGGSGAPSNTVGRQCNGSSDTTCGGAYECVQGCGPPVVRPDTPPPAYYCQLKGYQRPCPICLAEDTLIATPSGEVAVQNIGEGMTVWTADASGARVAAKILEVSRTPVPSTHRVVHLVLEDGRALFVSPGHPTADSRTMGDLKSGDTIDGSRVVATELVPYSKGFTYDLLPKGDTGFYWADGILIGSTLSQDR